MTYPTASAQGTAQGPQPDVFTSEPTKYLS